MKAELVNDIKDLFLINDGENGLGKILMGGARKDISGQEYSVFRCYQQGGGMNKKLAVLTISVLLLLAFSVASADKETGFGGKIYAHWYYDLSDTLDYSKSNADFDNYNAFGITRSYITGWAKLTDKSSGKITIDINANRGNSQNNIRLKYAYLKWKLYSGTRIGLAAKFGLHETPWIMGMNKIWGRRYLAKTPSDILGMETTSDNGISVIGKFGKKGKWGWASISIFNGASYSSPWDNNPSKDINLAAFIAPLNGNADFAKSTVGFQYYSGILNAYDDSSQTQDDYKKTLMSAVANFQFKKLLALGVEYDSYTSPQRLTRGGIWAADTSDNKETAIALFGTLWFEELLKNNEKFKSLNFFFRYMMRDPDTDDHDLPGAAKNEVNYTEMIFGVECAPYKGLKTSLNYRSDTTKNPGVGVDDISNAYLFLNAQFMF